jgi:hypothetical protein
MSKATTRCPYCAEEIFAAAKKCKHCGEFLDDDQPRSASTNPEAPSSLNGDVADSSAVVVNGARPLRLLSLIIGGVLIALLVHSLFNQWAQNKAEERFRQTLRTSANDYAAQTDRQIADMKKSGGMKIEPNEVRAVTSTASTDTGVSSTAENAVTFRAPVEMSHVTGRENFVQLGDGPTWAQLENQIWSLSLQRYKDEVKHFKITSIAQSPSGKNRFRVTFTVDGNAGQVDLYRQGNRPFKDIIRGRDRRFWAYAE